MDSKSSSKNKSGRTWNVQVGLQGLLGGSTDSAQSNDMVKENEMLQRKLQAKENAINEKDAQLKEYERKLTEDEFGFSDKLGKSEERPFIAHLNKWLMSIVTHFFLFSQTNYDFEDDQKRMCVFISWGLLAFFLIYTMIAPGACPELQCPTVEDIGKALPSKDDIFNQVQAN